MAGHNKWSKVKHVKARVDAKRGKLFSKLSKEISIAAKEGGGDPDLNPRLRQAVENAKAVSVPKDNIERAIKKGTGELGGEAIQEVTYEGFAPGGVGIIVEVATDNKNRSAADIRSIFNKNNGSLGSSGSVAHLFERKGQIRVALEAASENQILELALDAGAEDVSCDEEDHLIFTPVDQLSSVAAALREKNIEPRGQELVYIPQNSIPVNEESVAGQVLRICETLEDYDDTMNVFTNFDIPDQILESVAV